MKIRLALRHEGDWWNAYLADPDSMAGAMLIGSVRFGAAVKNPEVKQGFMALMQLIVADAIENATGETITDFEIAPAPEHERAGHT